jgi:hypothetical protein
MFDEGYFGATGNFAFPSILAETFHIVTDW